MDYILITGVSTGIGHTTVKILIDNGYFVFGSVRNEKDAKKLDNEFGKNFCSLIFDVTDYKAVIKAKAKVEAKLEGKKLSGLINNAGIAVNGPIMHLPIEDFEYQFKVNVFGLLKVTQVFLPLLGAGKNSSQKPGKIINISSVSGILTFPFLVPYCASKHAVESISDGLRRELSFYGIDVISIQPGAVKSPIWGKSTSSKNKYKDTDYKNFDIFSEKQAEESLSRALEAKVISKKILKVLNNKRPHTRYLIMKHKPIIRLLQILPVRWQDKIFIKRVNKIFE